MTYIGRTIESEILAHRATNLKHAKTARGKETHRRAKLKWRYGITPEDYDAMLVAQGGHCALCDRTPSDHRRLNIDHDHETGAVRGLLCDPHNRAIGNLGDNEAGLLLALEYIRGARDETKENKTKARPRSQTVHGGRDRG